MTTYYKVLGLHGEPHYGGNGKWNLPTSDGEPGEWMPKIEGLVECRSGYHVVTRDQLVKWLGPTIWIAEVRGDVIHSYDKSVAAEARLLSRLENWNENTARLFAVDCAERVLSLFEATYRRDNRPRLALKAARAFTRGEISRERAAAGAGGWAAAAAAGWAAAGAIAGAGAWEWQTQCLWQYLDGDVS